MNTYKQTVQKTLNNQYKKYILGKEIIYILAITFIPYRVSDE
jgi:hypothetical protein